MSVFQKLFKHTFIYGLSTVLPRVLGIILVPLFTTVLGKEKFGIYSALMAYFILGNVLLTYGMETAFFRFINKDESQRNQVQGTALSSLTVTSLLFLFCGFLFKEQIAFYLDFKPIYIVYAFGILTLDTLAVLPFAWFRANEKPMRYAVIKVGNVLINLGLNLFFFLVLPNLATPGSSWEQIVLEDRILYVFLANLIASALTVIAMITVYVRIRFQFNFKIWKAMFKYALPVLIAGIAFSINEAFDKILLKYLLPEDIADAEIGVYSGCYKLGVFMGLFSTAFRLGLEPFFFNYAKNKNAKLTYALITKYFTIFGSCVVLFVVVFVDVLKHFLLPDPEFWVALGIVPIILIANLCLGIYHNLSVWYKVTDRTKFGAYISLIGALITLILNFALIPMYSYYGSAIATLAAYGTMMLLSWYFGQKLYRIPYDLTKTLSYMGLAILIAVLSFYVFDRNYGYSIPMLIGFLVILYLGERAFLQQLWSQRNSS